MPALVADLRAIRDLLEKGWCQGSMRDRYGGMCLFAAMSTQVAATSDLRWRELCSAIYDVNGNKAVIPWNDAPGRTQAEVLKMLDNAILLAAEIKKAKEI